MKKVFSIIALSAMTLSLSSFNSYNHTLYAKYTSILSPEVDSHACWRFADNESQNNYNYEISTNTYEEDFRIWEWYYEYCMDGLWAPAVIVGQ